MLALVAPACDAPAAAGGEVLELERGTARLAPDARVVDVVLRTGAPAPVQPETVRVRAGDVVRFTAADARAHAIAFDRARLQPEAVAFLERTGQLRGPPLITPGARWIVSFDGAPPGAYPFTDASGDGAGAVLVAEPEPAGR